MGVLRYKIVSPIRLLLPISAALLVLPFIFKRDLMLFTTLPLVYFLASYFFLINFPGIVESLHKRPLYIEDLEVSDITSESSNLLFRHIYSIIMNFLLAFLFAGLSEYIILQNIREKPVVEVVAIIGGNLGLYYKIQDIIGKIMLSLCHYIKTSEIKRQRSNSIEIIELGDEQV